MGGNRARRVVALLTSATTCLVAVSVGGVDASVQVAGTRAEEGDWSGFVSFVGAGIPFRGSFAFTSAGGEVDGRFAWSGGGVRIAGIVSGPDTMPRFDLTEVVSGGVDVPDVSGGGEIEFTAATCERLEGTGVNIDVAQMIDVGLIVWWAVRADTASDLDGFFTALDALRVEVGEIVTGLEAGAVILGGGVLGRLEPLIAEAETLAAQLDRTEGCGAAFYRSVVASEIERVLLHLLANPDTDVFTIGQILLTAARGGVLGSGSETDTTVLDDAARSLLSERVADAEADGSVSELDILWLVADDMGWDDIADEALLARERVGS